MTAPSSPIPVRLPDELRKELDAMAVNSSASQVLRDGLIRLSRLRAPSEQPMYALMVDDPQVDEVIERAVSAACEVLDELFPGAPKESRGISSNFQGVLLDHIRAMLTGIEARHCNHRTYLNALLGRWDSFGSISPIPDGNIGYTVVKVGDRYGQHDLYYDEGQLKELAHLDPSSLFTSQEACAKAVMQWLDRQGLSPRDENLRMCVLEITDRGPLKPLRVA